MQIKDSVALVTGANRGLGLAFARALLEGGARKVYAAARDPKSVTLPGVVPFKLDVTNADDIARAVRELGDVTLLVNNAGIATGSHLLEADSLQKARQEFEVNVLGPLALSKGFARTLAGNGGGAIVNVLSVLSWLNLPGLSTYAVSKAAAWSLTNGLRNELRGQKTQVVGLHVGYVDTDLTKGIDAPKSNPNDVARHTLEAVIAGKEEVTADELSVNVKQGLASGVYLGAPQG